MALSFLAGLAEWSQSVITSFGYLGIFIVSFVGSATIIVPVPVFLPVFLAGSVMNPWLVGIVGGAGSALGELTGYVVGRGGEKLVNAKHKKWLDRAEKWFEKHGAFPVIILFAATPLPDDILGIICGAIKYDIKKFFVGELIGKIILAVGLAWAGHYGIQWLLNIFA